MSRLNSKLVLKTVRQNSVNTKFEIIKSTNTLDHGVPGDTLTREVVDKILVSAANRGPRNQLTVEFVK